MKIPPVKGAKVAPAKPRAAAKPSVTLTHDDESSIDGPPMCLQCDLLTHAIEEAVKTFAQAGGNLHLVMKEIRYMALEIGNCCGQPRDDEYSSSMSSARERIFWEHLEDHIKTEKFKPPPRPPATDAAKIQPGSSKDKEEASITENMIE